MVSYIPYIADAPLCSWAAYFWPSSVFLFVHCCFMSTETVGTSRDEESRTSTSLFTQLLKSNVLWSAVIIPITAAAPLSSSAA